MRIISVRNLKEFWEGSSCSDAEQSLRAWYEEARRANWESPADIKEQFRSASFVGNNRVVFNNKWNKYRLIVDVRYEFKIVYIRFVGTHKQYDEIDAKEI